MLLVSKKGLDRQLYNFGKLCSSAQGANGMISEAALSKKRGEIVTTIAKNILDTLKICYSLVCSIITIL